MLLEQPIPPSIRFIQFISHLILILTDVTLPSPAPQSLILLNRLLYTTGGRPRLYTTTMTRLQGSGRVVCRGDNIEREGHYVDI